VTNYPAQPGVVRRDIRPVPTRAELAGAFFPQLRRAAAGRPAGPADPPPPRGGRRALRSRKPPILGGPWPCFPIRLYRLFGSIRLRSSPAALALHTVGDLLRPYPRRYEKAWATDLPGLCFAMATC